MFVLGIIDGTVGGLLCLDVRFFHCSGRGSGFGSERNIPQTVGIVSFANNDNYAVLVNVDINFCKESDAVVVTYLSDGFQFQFQHKYYTVILRATKAFESPLL